MKQHHTSLKAYGLGLFIIASTVVGCNSLSGAPAGGEATSSAHHSTVATTVVKVFLTPPAWPNGHGLYSPEPCWTVSPSPLPTNWASEKIYVSYNSDGCSKRSIVIEWDSGYGPSENQACFYNIHYPEGGPFSFSTSNYYFIQCAVATAPPGKSYDEQLIYGPVGTHQPDLNGR